jgi:hypothetical protein
MHPEAGRTTSKMFSHARPGGTPTLILPMGWMESPPYFCCFMETISGLTNNGVRKHIRFPAVHHIEVHVDANGTMPLNPFSQS